MSKVRAGLRACRNLYDMAGRKSAGSLGGTESDMVSTCLSDDSTGPSSSTQLGRRWLRYKLKEQRSVGGSGGGYESADELCSSGGGRTESMDESSIDPGSMLISRLRKSSLGNEMSFSASKTARVPSKLYTAPVSGSLARCACFSKARVPFEQCIDELGIEVFAESDDLIHLCMACHLYQ
jgi:hypothetical protein